MKPIIEVHNLGKKYRIGAKQPYYSLRDSLTNLALLKWRRQPKEEIWSLKNINLSINPGETVGLIGPNGAGKSTLLKILSQITPPTTGRITLRGRLASLLEVGTGFNPELTGRENIFLNGAILGMSRQEIRKKFDKIVTFSEIEQFLDTPVKHYSSGMYVKLAFSVAAHLDPEMLIVDEVLSVGDIAFQQKSIGKMEEVANKEGRTIIFVSHNMSAIALLCKRTVLLKQGELVFDGETGTAINTYLKSINETKSFNQNIPRRGNGLARVVGLYLMDKKKQRIEQVTISEPFDVGFDVEFKPEAIGKNVAISLLVSDQKNNKMVTLSTEIVRSNFTARKASQKYYCQLNEGLPVIPGFYRLSYIVKVGGQLADRVSDALGFDVIARDLYGTGKLPGSEMGCLLVKNRWI